ncbi:non-ribosomal peptide synthase domain TIGR01720/amino acid adenylation domain-containing protein [Pseudomonas sp. NFIX10]|uniref:non-ribosomal peptide synthetase n=1 Tax=unclassified Pseudomonas TaxID=196821 RepID=UPI0008EEDB78|nr:MULTISPECIES: non-ribosomal peptide synthetase [unclassified Pseudomonas]SFB29483.1 non-ribosomal peptide synthase domain TIGR01720/amino acid adenylation domain-containing protein [Pseudomonas sp. NFIX10]SFE90769.1 non-ribosomal peptide synthase domain TIGR01720/amino acid adenylation domain-containing protein [Pseudomonas sp. NFACC06-1]
MNAEDALKLARRFIGLPLEKRRMFLAALDKEGVEFSGFPIPRGVEAEDRQALSYAQQRMWFLWQLEPGSGAYNLPGAVRLKGALSLPALEQAFASLVARHETLRTVFQRQADDRLLQVPASAPLVIDHADFSAMPAGEREQAVRLAAEAQSMQPFDLSNGPLLRVELLKLDEQEHVLLLTLHHIVSDGWSMNVLIDEFIRFYDAHEAGVAPQLADLPIQYSDYALWQRRWLEAGELQRQLDYWQAQLGDEHPVLELPLDYPRPVLPSYRGRRLEHVVEAALVEQLRGVARQQGVTLFMLLLGTFSVLLHRYTGQDDLRVGVPVANRNRQEIEGLIGFFVNTQVLRVQLDGQARLGDLLRDIKETALGAQAHQDLPFERLVEALKLERSLSYNPLFQVMYNHQPEVADVTTLKVGSGLELGVIEWESRSTQFDLSLDTYEKGGQLHAAFTYASDLFNPETIERMARHWTLLLRNIIADPQRRVGELALLAPAEYRQLVTEWGRHDTTWPSERPVHELFEAQAEHGPDAIALICDGQRLTYGQLNAQSNRLARTLVAAGVGPDVLVGIAVDRSLELVVAILAVLKASGAYVPLDPQYPVDRLRFMIQDSASRLLLTQSHWLERLPVPDGVRCLCLDQSQSWEDAEASNLQRQVWADSLAYVMFTSGSTGRPKGVGISHGALSKHAFASQHYYGLSSADCVLQFATFNFDAFGEQLFGPLTCGASVVLRGNEVWDSETLYRHIVEQGITVMDLTTAYWNMIAKEFAAAGPRDYAALRQVHSGGEAMPPEGVQAWRRAGLEQVKLLNTYGPTEATVTATTLDCSDYVFNRRPLPLTLPIGQPLPGRHTYLLDGHLEPTPVGVVGELLIGGELLARGYFQRPGLTAERFIPDPFSTTGARLYRTGDLTRFNTLGQIEYVGRVDHQVKIRGLRIELGEVEARLLELDAVNEAVVLAVQGGSSLQLVGYVVPKDASLVSATAEEQGTARETLKAQLKDHLPDYMVPTQLLFLAQLPLSPNGKLDRKALPSADASQLQQAFIAPRSELERGIAAIWQDVLKLEQVGLTDNFFELGGDSIISIQVVSRSRQAGIHFTPRDLFQHQTVQGLASVAQQGGSGLQIDQGPVSGELPLLPIQQVFFEDAIAQRHHWNQAVLLRSHLPLQAPALMQALNALVAHHDALRSRFTETPTGWRADVAPVAIDSELLWTADNLSAAELQDLCAKAQRSLDLQKGPLLRAILANMADGSQRLLLAVHHLAVDGVSWRILLEDLQRAYQQTSAGAALQLPAKTSAYKAWGEHLQVYASTETLRTELTFWQQKLRGAVVDLPWDNPQGSRQSRYAKVLHSRLDKTLTQQLLQQAPAAYRTQVNDLLLTALARVICRWTGHADALIQLEGHGREELFSDVDLTRTVGWFTSLFPVRLTPADSVGAAIKQIKEQLRAIPNKGIGFGVLRYLGDDAAQACLKALPLPCITFNYLGQFDGSFDASEGALFSPAGESAGLEQSLDAPLDNGLGIEGQVYDGELDLRWTFSTEQFNEATIARLADDYARELEALIDHCCQADAMGVTPSDFPLARITQAQLDAIPLPAAAIEDIYPLSPMQQGMLFHTLYEQGTGTYINQLCVDVDGLDPERFRAAWQATLDAHEILRSGFIWQGELQEQLQVIHRRLALPYTLLDWRGRNDVAQALKDFTAADLAKGFDLTQAGLLRVTLIQLSDERHHLIFTNHHILMDGWSSAQMLGEVLQRYAGQQPPRPVSRYADYIQWLQRQDTALSETFWLGQLADLQEPTLLANAAAASAEVRSESAHALRHYTLDAPRTGRLNAFARQQKVTVNTLVQAAWLLLLQRYTGSDCVAFGTTVAGRPAELVGIEQQVGLFINTLPVIAGSRPDQTVAAWLAAVQARNLSLREFEHTPLANIQRWAGQGGGALFDSLLVFENFPISAALQRGTAQGVVFGEVANQDQTHYPLTLGVTLGETLALHMSFDRAHFSVATIERLSAQLLHLLERFADSAERRLGEIALASDEEHKAQQAANHPQPYPTDIAVHQRIAHLAALKPHGTAVIFDGQRFSYGDIDRRANQLAHTLIARGMGPETRVGVALPRSEGVIVALLAVLKAGAAYVPLDTSYPRERLAYLIEDSGLALLLTDSRVSAQLPLERAAQVLELDRLDLSLQPIHAPAIEVDPQNLAYVIYTSGSTGNPKGVSVAHGPLAMHCQAIGERYEMRDSDCEFHFMSFAFDGAHERWLTSLTHGASLLIRDDSLWTPEQTYNAMREHGVTVVAFPPVYLQQLAEHAEREGNPPRVRIYCFGGDAVPNASFERVKRALDPDFIINGYGPTETVVTPLIWKAGRDVTCGAAYAPIGSRIGDRSAYVLDADLNLLPQGMAGELYLGGSGLARGYLNRPGLTAERFVADPFSAEGGLLYRTGDLVRQRADGTFDYLDRIDNQVKIRGFRIELGEVEASLQALDGVRETVVVAQEGPAGSGKRLVAYVVADESAAPREAFAEHLREQLKATLPAHMVPAYLLLLERLPLTPNGKLDRKNLPKPDVSQLQQTYVAPRSPLEQQLATIWQDVLKLGQVGLQDNFFELGGDSIVSIQVVSRARLAGIQFTPKDLFQHQTIEALAAVAQTGAPLQVIDQQPVTGETALLPIHQWFFAQPIPDRHHWNQSVMLKPTQALDAQALEQALGALIEHHDSLRLDFIEEGEGWTARYRDVEAQAAGTLLWQADVADLAELEVLGNRAQRSLQLDGGPLLRALLANLADGTQRLLLIVHHLVVDGVSWRILFEDLQSAYRQMLAGTAVQLPAKTSAVKAWAAALQDYAASAPLQAELGFWQQQLQGASAGLPWDNPQGGQQHSQAVTIRSALDKTLTRQLLQQAPAAYRTQVNDLLLTALARVMVRWTGDDSVWVQLEGHGREDLFDHVDLSRTVGWFTSLFPAKLTPAADLGASLKQIKEQLRAIPNKGIGFGALAHLGDDSARQTLQALPKPQLTFNYLGQFDGSFDGADEALFVPTTERGGEEVNLQGPLGSPLALDGQVFGGELDLSWTFSGDRFDAATIQRLADDYVQELTALIAHCCDSDSRGVTPSDFPLARLTQVQLDTLVPHPQAIDDIYPLSPMQQGMLFHSLLGHGSGDYINQMRLDVEGVDPQRFRAAWQAVVDAHDILRTGFFWQGDLEQPVQIVQRQVEVPFRVLDWNGRTEIDDALQTLADEERAQGVDLTQAPLMRLVLVRTGTDRHHLIYTNHHILMDGWSSAQLLGEVLQHYRGDSVARPTGRYRDYIAWLQRQDASLGEGFWTQQLRTLDEPVRLAQVFARPAQDVPATLYGHHRMQLDGMQTRRLAEFAREAKVTVNTLVQAAWLLLLQRYTGKASVAFGATVAGRPADLVGVEGQIGLFINTLPVIASPRPEQDLGDWLHSVQAQNLALREFEHTALFDIQRWAGLGGEALFDNILVFENYPISEALAHGAPEGLRFGAVDNLEQTNYPLTLLVSLGAELAVQFSYQCARFTEASVEQIGVHLRRLLLQMIDAGQRPLGELSVLDERETRQHVQDWNATAAEYPQARCVHRLFEAQARQTPVATALVFADQVLSYAELDVRANRLAHRLIEQGVGPDRLVGVALERGVDMIVALLAILKAGGAYLPLDPAFPQDRLAYMIEDSGIELLLTQRSLLDQLPLSGGSELARDGGGSVNSDVEGESLIASKLAPTGGGVGVKTLVLDQEGDWLDGYAGEAPAPRLDAEHLAYAIYTSGSTGKPKGVMVRHGALVNFVASMAREPGIAARDRVLSLTTFSFDIFGLELYGALLSGACVVLVDKQSTHDPEALLETIDRQQVSVVQATPSTWRMLLDHPASGLLAGRKCLCGGEALAEDLAERLLDVAGEVWNLYGPTETTIWSAAYRLTQEQCVPYLGRPIANTSLYIVGDHFAPNPVGLIGELLIGGDGLARGYHDRAALTAERFLPDPFGNGARVYRTGDLARQRGDGVIEYIGRVDHQVKIRGFRIELGEIEACLLAQEAIREAVVVPQPGPGGLQLVAYLVATDPETAEPTALREALKAQLAPLLPDYMMPAHWLLLERLPLTPNGKLDRKALPLPDAQQLLRAYVAPQGALEQGIADIWQDVLKLERVGRDDNFFELGGHSLLATQATARLQMEQGAAVPLDLLFSTTSLADYAAQLAAHLTPHSSADLSEMHDFLADLETL